MILAIPASVVDVVLSGFHGSVFDVGETLLYCCVRAICCLLLWCWAAGGALAGRVLFRSKMLTLSDIEKMSKEQKKNRRNDGVNNRAPSLPERGNLHFEF
jgi:hypothetical protein